jgi:hypothetical protein
MVNRKDMEVARRALALMYANVTERAAIRQPPDEVGSRSIPERSPLVLQTRDIDHETVLHISFHHSFIRFIDLLNWDGLDVRGNAVFGAVVEHFLRFLNTADHRTDDTVSTMKSK